MKRKVLLLILIALYMMFSLSGCNFFGKDNSDNNLGNGPDGQHSSDQYTFSMGFEDLQADLSDAKSLGIFKKKKFSTSSQTQASKVSYKRLTDTEEENEEETYVEEDEILEGEELVLGCENEQGEVEEVPFKDYELGDDVDVTQDAEVYQLYVRKDVTFISYISNKIRKELESEEQSFIDPKNSTVIEEFKLERFTLIDDYHDVHIYNRIKGVPEDFDTKFNPSKFVKVYLINNDTGKIYDLAHLGDFRVESGIIITEGENRKFFDTKFEEESLKLEEITLMDKTITPQFYKEINSGVTYIRCKENYSDKVNKRLFYKTDKEFFIDEENTVFILSEDTNGKPVLHKIVDLEEVSANFSEIKGKMTALFEDYYGIRDTYCYNNYFHTVCVSGESYVFDCQENYYIVNPRYNIPYMYNGKYVDKNNDDLVIKDYENNIIDVILEDFTEDHYFYQLQNGYIVHIRNIFKKRIDAGSFDAYRITNDEAGEIIVEKLDTTIIIGTDIVLQPIN
jgi:hypothetical protein